MISYTGLFKNAIVVIWKGVFHINKAGKDDTASYHPIKILVVTLHKRKNI